MRVTEKSGQAPRSAPPILVDTTLRDGEQAPGVAFRPAVRRALVRLLCRVGVTEIEAGTPAMGDDEQAAIRALVGIRLDCRLSCWCRARREDLEAAGRCGTPAVHVSFPASPRLLAATGKKPEWVMGRLATLIPFARREFDQVTVGAQDATRAEPAFLRSFARAAQDLGADRLRLADSVGIATPRDVTRLVGRLWRTAPGLALEFHGHNDLGMAVANSVAAVQAGAAAVSATVNGLGERAGNAALEEVAAALTHAAGRPVRIHWPTLLILCHLVARASGRPLPRSKPLIGADVFTHESGIHCAALLRDPLSYQPLDPAEVGRGGTVFTAGRHSGSAILQHLLAQQGILATRRDLTPLLVALRRQPAAGQSLDAERLADLYRRCRCQPAARDGA